MFQIGQHKIGEGAKKQDATNTLHWKVIDTFYNWAPFLAVAVVPPSTSFTKDSGRQAFKAKTTPKIHTRKRIFGTSGKGAWGAVSELRMGWEFTVSHTLLPQEILQGGNHSWSMRDLTIGWEFNFVSTPFSTIAINWAGGSVELETISSEPTLTMALIKLIGQSHLSSSKIVQVTSAAINILRVEESDDASEEPGFSLQLVNTWPFEAIIASAIDAITGFIVLAIREHGRIILVLKRLRQNSNGSWDLDQVGNVADPQDDPTCMEIFASPSKSGIVKQENGAPYDGLDRFVIIGTDTGKVLCFRLDTTLGFQDLSEFTLSAQTACESICAVSSSTWTEVRGICGLRNGSVVVFGLEIDDRCAAFSTKHCKTFSMGGISPSTRLCAADRGPGCYVYGGADTCYINLSPLQLDHVGLDNIWLTDRANRSLNQTSMAAVCQVSYVADNQRHADSTIFLDANAQVYFGSLAKSIEPLPRRIPVPGTPSRLIYSNYLQCLIVASTIVEVDVPSHKRFESSAIILMDPDGEAEETEMEESNGVIGTLSIASQSVVYLENTGERIQCLTEWQVGKDKDKHHFVVVGTAAHDSSNGRNFGFIHLFQFRFNEAGQPGLKLMKTCRESRPVGAVCAWDHKTLLYCTGDQIRKRTVTPEDRETGYCPTST